MDEGPHLPPISFMALSEAILKAGVLLPLHPFIDQVLQFFDIVPFQLTPNSYCIIMVFFISFSKACGIEPSIGHFAYVFRIKAIMKHVEFWYLTSHGDVAGTGGLPSKVGQWKNDFFFYLFARFGEFWIGHKWQPSR